MPASARIQGTGCPQAVTDRLDDRRVDAGPHDGRGILCLITCVSMLFRPSSFRNGREQTEAATPTMSGPRVDAAIDEGHDFCRQRNMID